jgi:indole-3-glycerol phosphate synthase / phosphoribosylanthranilate isomerase
MKNPAITLTDIGQAKADWLKTAAHLPTSAEGLPPASGAFLTMLRQTNRHRLPCQLIAEIKPKSPSAGVLAEGFNLAAVVHSFEQHAQGFSVLTDEPFFNGSFDTLQYVTTYSQKPALCKDFILDPRQLWQARACGAEAVLLIVKLLQQDVFIQLHNHCKTLHMTPVVEIQNRDELQRAMAVQPDVLLINNRDLMTFAMNMSTSHDLAACIPHDIAVIAASGYGQDASAIQAIAPKVNAILMGSHLMPLASSPAQLDAALRAVVAQLH